MKTRIITLLSCVVVALTAQAQYQLTNGDFESWETVEYTVTKVCEEPTLWSSLYDATGSMKSLSTSTRAQIYKDEDVRPESAGQYSCRITSNSAFGVVTLGNLTNGCVNMGSISSTDASGNYNYINEERSDQAMRFTGRPDAVRFWVKFSGVNAGKCNVLLTTKGYYQDPVYEDRNTAVLVGQALPATVLRATMSGRSTLCLSNGFLMSNLIMLWLMSPPALTPVPVVRQIISILTTLR